MGEELMRLWGNEACSNETWFGVVLGEGVDAIEDSPHGHWGRHPIKGPVDLFLHKELPGKVLKPLHHCILDVFIQESGWILYLECCLLTVSLFLFALTCPFCCIVCGWILVCHACSHVITCDWCITSSTMDEFHMNSAHTLSNSQVDSVVLTCSHTILHFHLAIVLKQNN